MTNKKITEYDEATALIGEDLLLAVTNVSTTPTTKKIGFTNLLAHLTSPVNIGAVTNSNGMLNLYGTTPSIFMNNGGVGGNYGGGIIGWSVNGQGGRVAIGTYENSTTLTHWLTINHVGQISITKPGGIVLLFDNTGGGSKIEFITTPDSSLTAPLPLLKINAKNLYSGYGTQIVASLEFQKSGNNNDCDFVFFTGDQVERLRIGNSGIITVATLAGSGNRPVYANASGQLYC